MGHHRRGELDAAEVLYHSILRDNGEDAQVLDLLSTMARQRRNDVVALSLSQRAVSAAPASWQYLLNLGEACRANGLFDEAVDAYQRSLQQHEATAAAHRGLAQAHAALGRDCEATRALKRALELEPKSVKTLELLAACLMRRGLFEEAEGASREAVNLQPEAASHHGRIAALLATKGDLRGAEAGFRRAAELRPDWAVPHLELSRIMNRLSLPWEAAEAALQAIRLDDKLPGAHRELGLALKRQYQFTAAAAAFLAEFELRPDDVESLVGLAGVESQRLAHESALARFHRAVVLIGRPSPLNSTLLEAMNYPDGINESEIFEEHVRWGRTVVECPPAAPGLSPDRAEPDRRLRIGYVSADLRDHPVPRFLEPILNGHDRGSFVPVIFSNAPREDAVTQHLRGIVPEWYDTHALNDDTFAATMREASIDILVDLGGHTARNRLPAFAQRLAPVQVSYLGYPNTTGLPRDVMQYRLTDAICDPADELHTERLVRLPGCFLCYRPPADAPEIAPPPLLKLRKVTFGCFNNMVRITRRTIADWATVLLRVPGSRLLLKNKVLGDPGSCNLVADEFAKHGIGEDRLLLLPYEPRGIDHLARYAQLDIALDTCPYNGTTTTCEGLWMGVPLVTRAGPAHRSRVGKSLLAAIGLEELAADSADGYIERAVELANTPERLASLRQSLRDRMQISCLRDEGMFVKNLEAAFRAMWWTACQS